MSILYVLLAILVGFVAIITLWFHSPVLAILCAPLVASLVTAISSVISALPRNRRSGGFVHSPSRLARAP